MTQPTAVTFSNWHRFQDDLRQFRRAGTITITGAWNQATGAKDFDVSMEVGVSETLLCEGMYLLHPEIIDLVDFVVLLEIDASVARKHAEKKGCKKTKQR